MIFDIHDDDVYWCAADCGWVTGHSYIVYGPLANHTTGVMYEGAPDWPDKDRWWSIIERYGVTILYTAPTAIRSFMRWGTEFPEQARPLVDTAARLRRGADQPRGVGLVLEGDRRRAMPGRRHVVADRDRRDHDHAAARADHPQAGLRHVPVPGRSRPMSSMSSGASVPLGGGGFLVLTHPWPAIARTIWGDPGPVRADVLQRVRTRDLRRRRRREA